MAKVTIDGQQYVVTDNLGYNHDAGGYVKMVKVGTSEKAIIRARGMPTWRFWDKRDIIRPSGRYQAIGQ